MRTTPITVNPLSTFLGEFHHLVHSRGYPHHLAKRTGGRSDVRLILRSLLAQLRTRPPLPESLPELTKALEETLAGLAAKRPPVVLVLDALDELPEGTELPFLGTDGLPDGAFVVATSRPGLRLERFWAGLHREPRVRHRLGPLAPDESVQVLLQARPGLPLAEAARIHQAAQGSALYVQAVANELREGRTRNDLPASVEDFYKEATVGLRDSPAPALLDVLGLICVARRPLSLRELAQASGLSQRAVEEKGVRPVRPFLTEAGSGFAFYHERFREFVLRELLYEDELPGYHRRLADWLRRPEGRATDYHLQSLAYHLHAAGDGASLLATIDPAFLAGKVRRLGYAVLEDVELLTRALADADAPALVGHCVGIVEKLSATGGLLEEAHRAVKGRLAEPSLPSVPGIDLFACLLPKAEVGADFVEAVKVGEGLALAVGDAPGGGLMSAFVARFIADRYRRLADRPPGEILDEVDRTISAHPRFEMVSMLVARLDLAEGLLTLASAGHPYPVLYSAKRKRCDRLPVRGDLLHGPRDGAEARYAQAEAEIAPGDVLVMLSDGLTEGHRTTDAYGYRFTRIVEEKAGQGARAISEAILDDWRAHPRTGDYSDDVTLLVAVVQERSKA